MAQTLATTSFTLIWWFQMLHPWALTWVGSYRLSLVCVVEELYKVNNTISLFPYGKPNSNKSLILKMGSSLGDSLSQLSNYFDGLRLTRDAYPPLCLRPFGI